MNFPNLAPTNTTGQPRILVASGIGDIYWVLVKLRAFMRQEGIERPELLILTDENSWSSSRLRAVPFLKMVPFIDVGDPPTVLRHPPGKRLKELDKFYNNLSTKTGNEITKGFLGYEWLMCYNGMINTGNWLESDPLECEWYFTMEFPPEQEEYRSACMEKYGRYAVFFFSLVGDFVRLNLTQFSLESMAKSINMFCSSSGRVPIFIGAWWDLHWPVQGHKDLLPMLLDMIPNHINLVGQTTLPQAFGIMQGADIVAGYHCGLTNMAIVFGKPTVLLWAEGRFPANTMLAVAPPDTRMTTYVPLFTKGLTVEKFAGVMGGVVVHD